jgi:hypothetical protein
MKKQAKGPKFRVAFGDVKSDRCACRFSDSWRCASYQQLRTVHCTCECHRVREAGPARGRKRT